VSITVTRANTELTDQSQEFAVTGTITNHGAALDNAEVGLRLAASAFADRASLDQWQTPDLNQVRSSSSWECKAERIAIEAGASVDYSLKCLVSEMNLGNLPGEPGWGPRGFMVTVATAQAVLGAVPGYLTYCPPKAIHAKTRLTVVAPLVRAPGETWSTTAARLERLVAATEAAEVTWLLDPAVLVEEAAHLPSTSPRPLAIAVNHGLENGRPVYVLPYGDPDLARLAHAPVPADALVDQAQNFGEAWLNQLLGAPAASLTRTGVARFNSPVDGAALRLASNGGARALLTGSSGPATGVARPGHMVELSTGSTRLPALVSDSALAQAILGSPNQTVPRIPGYVLAVLAHEAVGQQVQGRPGRTAVILPQDLDPADNLSQDLAKMLGADWVLGIGLDAALETRPNDRLGLAESVGTASGPSDQQLSKVIETVARAKAFATITEHPEQFDQTVLGGLFDAVSIACGDRVACDWAATQAAAIAATRMDEVAIVTGGEINLISGEGKVPIVVSNRSADTISNLRVELDPQTAALRTGEGQVITIPAGGQATARIDVSAVANGTVQIQVNLVNQDGQLVAPPAGFTMRVRAGWEDAFTAAAGGLAVVVLIIGLTRSVQRRRRTLALSAGSDAVVAP